MTGQGDKGQDGGRRGERGEGTERIGQDGMGENMTESSLW